MFKSSPLSLTIPQPCQQAWENMTPDGTGKLCGSCNKTVIDFTNLSDEEVLAVIQRSTGKICGRFLASQLDRNLFQQKRHQNTLLPVVMISSVLVAGAASTATAQPEIASFQSMTADTTMPIQTAQPAKTDTPHSVTGKVVDADGIGLHGATVRIKGSGYSTVTNENGNFHLNIPNELSNQCTTLEFLYIGFKKREFQISDVTNLLKMDVVMQLDQIVLGEMNVVVVRKLTLWQRIKRALR